MRKDRLVALASAHGVEGADGLTKAALAASIMMKFMPAEGPG